ncbi:Uncharacterised protein [Mycobacterium tuberculosis]|uniref:Uncharacterized protein n=1 Tax=Mycobacterium tuberculosis TaxID=1773 RepID=A0A655JID0_MYCTX|nr:Uncharacterised protein [Mycobacterium tuberculosis]CNV17094.1 Uncharacterised protein [Mycobacterium tuberculosis]COW98804.1 Uncharacterised protein [Mycobacterium tuberculosis]
MPRRAVGVARRVVQHDADHVAGIVGSGDSGEGDPIHVVEVAAAARVDLLRGTGLAGHLIAGHPGRRPGTLLVAHRIALHHGTQHLAHGLGGLRRHHANVVGARFFGSAAVGCDGGLDNAWGYPHSIVGDGLVHAGHLQQSHRKTLANRKISERTARPLVDWRHQSGALTGQAHAGALSQPELAEHIVIAFRSDTLGKHQRADVGGLSEHPRGGIGHHAVLPSVMHGNTAHLDRARHL